jgi:hypothetical protein
MANADTWKTHQGGTVTVTKTGLIHKAGNSYSGKVAAQESKQAPVSRKGR